ncbi:MAG: Eco29kI family restriction endonuclease [Candidatus Acidiferrales bacterium]
MPDTPFNPLDKLNLAESLAEAMLKRPISPLPPEESFGGAGVYAIYYAGTFAPYKPLAYKNRGADPALPIYVGKAVPPGARKGGLGLGANPGTALLKRLKEHAKSIEEAGNLDLRDFSCRYLICDDIWIPLGEALLIARFRPPWNVLIEGFGIHTPGKGRKKQVKSKWDTLHVGRSLAKGLPANPMSAAKIVTLIADFFEGKKVPTLSPIEAIVEEEEEIGDR